MDKFIFNSAASVVFEPGVAGKLGQRFAHKLGKSVLFVTDKGIRKLGLCDAALADLTAAGISATIFDDVEADPSLATLLKAADTGRKAKVTGVVGFGGGSSLDVAKLAALLVGSGEDIDQAWGVGNAKGPRLALVLIPTTSGTGSEVTPVSIISIDEEEKRGVSSALLIPDIAVLDPELTYGLPAPITAATGIDAMVHAIEAYASKNSNNNPISKIMAKQALILLGGNVETAVHDGRNSEARSAMLLGACLAGAAFANSPVAAVHALAYPIGSIFHVPHGVSNALVLPHVLRFNIETDPSLYSDIIEYAFPNGATKDSIADQISALMDRVKLPAKLREVGIKEADLPRLASAAMKQTRLLVNNPREVTEANALRIYQAAW